MIEDIITLTKESEYKSREIAVEKRKGDVLLYDVSMRLEFLLISLKYIAATLIRSNEALSLPAAKVVARR